MQCDIMPVAKTADRSKVCVANRGGRRAAKFFCSCETNSGKKHFCTSGALGVAPQAKEEWIGRTETMQFQIITCVSAPLKGANCMREFMLHE